MSAEPFEPEVIPASRPRVEPQAEVSDPDVPQPEPERDEVARIDPEPTTEDAQGNRLALENGAEFDLEPLKLRQFLRLLRIITRGASANMESIDLNFDDAQAFASGFISLILFAVPEAEEETVFFLQSMVKPTGLDGKPAAKNEAMSEDDKKWETLFENLVNPSLDDTLTILQRIVEVEGEDLRALGKRVQKMLDVATAMGATGKNSEVQVP